MTSASPKISSDLLRKSDKILFIAHLALGDFTYLQNFFQHFSQAYPHLRIDLWVDEVRRTSKSAEWKYLKKYSLYDWVAQCPFFEKIYNRTYSPQLLRESTVEAQSEHYPLVVSLATLRPHFYAELARKISPHGFVAGIKPPLKLLELHHHLAFRKLDAAIPPSQAGAAQKHITDTYAGWFQQLFGLDMPASARHPFVDIPQQWQDAAQRQLALWGFYPGNGKIIFINPFAKTKKRCWPLDKVVGLIKAMQAEEAWRDACFIVNAVPQELEHARSMIGKHHLARTELFSAEENFFQLPAMLRLCDLIISVETAVMHLANAVGVPVLALMRQKNPEWAPIDEERSTVITTVKRREWVDAIPVESVLKQLPSHAEA
ncbi:lipopolysaccharide heptosyltransferase family protein|uniref:glycosyltransferase family 9 protein n=1 Tax=Noviherbaspirillum sp. L7-7A TaxID=2850560 RepID=UPI001C2B77E9|nr:glycosyltransferase family 9 protein [Noviherbaspirillum sp. L7-7A]MBV0879957.1 lipopolysaccharide heptosyltransferase family protein [Noviherbaspirillum sp. L7-7A]